ncbi:hypothetical protein DFI02_104299 [Rhizobium sp. PP-F2F-G20b]|nr:hypothetical protein DFI02_104299 [Rhizobium sp. PP-F2F-G20b]
MEVDLAPETAQAGADRPIDRDSIGPDFGILVAHRPPYGFEIKRAADAGALRWRGIAVPVEPAQAIVPGHMPLDQRPLNDLPRLARRFHGTTSSSEIPSHCSTTGCWDERWRVRPASSRTFMRIGTILTSPAAWRRIMQIEIVSVGVRRVETSTRSPSSSSSRMGTSVHAGVTIFVKAGIDAQPSPLAASMRLSRMFPAETIWTGNGRTFGDTSRRDGLSPFAAPSRYRRDGAVGHWPDLATGRHQRQRRRLHASAEAENAQVRSRRCEAPPRRWTCR